MKVVAIHNFIVNKIHKSRKKNDPKLMGLGFIVDDKLEVKEGQYFNPETEEVRDATFEDLLFAGLYNPLITKAKLIAGLTADELTDLYTKKSSKVDVEILWDKLSTQIAVDIVENPALQNNGILTQARLEELISI
jgi:hypothetical protein